MGYPTFKLKELQIPDCWTIVKNDFVDLEPDNNYPIDQVFHQFYEDILNTTYKDYMIDLGFYGRYSDNDREGFFKIVVFKGDFNDGEFFEFFISRSTDKIKDKLNFYFDAIPTGKLDKIKGISYDDNYDFNSFHIYSAIDNINYRLTNKDLEEIAKPKRNDT